MKKIIYWGILLWTFPFVRFMEIKTGYAFYGPVQIYHALLAEYLPLFFPLIALLLSSVFFTEQVRENFLSYVRPRQWLLSYIKRAMWKNIATVFSLIFMLFFTVYLFAFYIVPTFELIALFPETQYPDDVVDTFTQSALQPIYEVSPLLYGLVYSALSAVIASLLSAIALLLLIITRRTFIAFVLPFGVFHLVGAFLELSGWKPFVPSYSIFIYNHNDVAPLSIGIWIVVLFSLVVWLFYRMKRTVYEWN